MVGGKSRNKETYSGPFALTFGSFVFRNPDFKAALSKNQGGEWCRKKPSGRATNWQLLRGESCIRVWTKKESNSIKQVIFHTTHESSCRKTSHLVVLKSCDLRKASWKRETLEPIQCVGLNFCFPIIVPIGLLGFIQAKDGGNEEHKNLKICP